MNSAKAFRWIKVSGLLSLIPIVLAVAPMAGYLAGEWLVLRFGLPAYTIIVCVMAGFAASIRETVRIIRTALRVSSRGT